MRWLRGALLPSIAIALLVFGAVADRALVQQSAAADQTILSDLDEKTRVAPLWVAAALDRVEQAAIAGERMADVAMCRVTLASRTRAWDANPPYATRARRDLETLLMSRALTDSGLPEAVVAALALDDAHAKATAADQLLSGALPVSADDVSYLAGALGVGGDARLTALVACLRRAPAADGVGPTPEFRRALTDRGTIESWSRDEAALVSYEIAILKLLELAGVGERVHVAVDSSSTANQRIVSVPNVAGLMLAIEPDSSVRIRIRMLRAALWIAVGISVIGLAVLVRAVSREARAVAKEKAFLASITHELRTPLTAIRVFGETLAEGRGNPAEYGALVAQESRRLEDLVEEVLTVARVDAAPSFAPVQPDELIASAVRLIAPRAEARSVHITFRPTGTLPEASWDQDGVRRALLNLLDNAVRHGNADGHVDVAALSSGESIRITVSDDGPGIGRRDRKRVFGRFERGSTDSAGTGLGLAVVDQVARAHGGRVELVTEENRGCAFTLVLPLRGRASVVSPAASVPIAADARS